MSQPNSAAHSAAFDQMLDQMKSADQDFVNGDPIPVMELWSTAADVSILGEGGGYDLGWEQVGPTLVADAALINSGHGAAGRRASASEHGQAHGAGYGPVEGSGHIDTDILVKGISPNGHLAYTVGIERGEAHVLGHKERRAVMLRVTTLYRWEAGRWKIIPSPRRRSHRAQIGGLLKYSAYRNEVTRCMWRLLPKLPLMLETLRVKESTNDTGNIRFQTLLTHLFRRGGIPKPRPGGGANGQER